MHYHGLGLAVDCVLGDDALDGILIGRQIEHGVGHNALDDGTQAAGAALALERLLSDGTQRALGELQLDVVKAHQLLILLDQRVLRLGQDVDQRSENISYKAADGTVTHSPVALGVVLIVTAIVNLFGLIVSGFQNFDLQKRVSILGMLLSIGYYLLLGVYAWILSAALVFSACPISAQAEESTEGNTQVTEEQQSEAKEETKGSETQKSDMDEAEETQEAESEEMEETSEEETSVEESSDESSEEEVTTQEEATEVVTEEVTVVEEQKVALFAEVGNVTKTCPTIGTDGKVTFHYYPEDGEEVNSAYVKGSWSASWDQYFYMTEEEPGVWSVTADLSLEKSYEYGIVVNENWVGDPTNPRNGGNSEILRNPYFNSDGSVTIFYYPQGDESVKLLYKTADDSEYKSVAMTQDAYHSALLSATITEQGNYTYALEVDGSQTADVNCKEASFVISKLPEDDASVKSPVVNGNKVTFNYFAPTAGSVNLAGEMNGWSSSATALTYNETTGFWSVEQELAPGRYEYKFVVDGGNWVMDTRNEAQSSGNSLCVVSGLESTTLDVEAVSEVVLPASLRMFDENGTASDVTPDYTIEEQYQSTLTVADGKIAVPSNFTAESFKVIASYGEYSSEVVVNVQANVYTYTIYYLDNNHQDVSSASLWIWSDGVNGTQYFFTDKEELEDGNTWLKAEVAVPFDGLYMIPRAHDDWSWQDVDKSFDNTEAQKNVTLYLMNGDTTAYTSIPDAVEKEYRYVIVEYNRPANDYTGWNIYSWNTGYGSEVTVDFKEIAGKMVAMIPVVDTKESISFCMRRSEDGNAWAEKDGGDHTVAIPLDQRVVKASFEQGEGVTGNLPYNIGYETDVTADEITFYYRDDALYEKYEEASLEGKIKLVWDGAEYEMAYDAQNERYFYTGKLEAGDHYYGYNVDGNLVIEMEKKGTEEHKECCDGKECKEGKNRRYIRREFTYAKFRQTLLLPENAERDEIHAKVENGVLHVCIPKMLKPKTEEEKREIEIH